MAYDPKDPADKKIVDDLIKTALAEAEAEYEQNVQGLKTKNTELLGKLKKAEAGENNAAEVSRLETALEENQTKLKQASKDLKAAITERDTFKQSFETESGVTRNLLVDNGLTDALTKANVAPAFLPAVKALLSGKVELKVDGTNRTAVVGDKALGDFIKEWSQGDEGKHYIAAPANGGTGARGANQTGNTGTKSMSRADFETMQQSNPAGVSEFFKGGGVLTDT